MKKIEEPIANLDEAIKLLKKNHSFRNPKFDNFRDNKEVVSIALKKDVRSFKYISDRLKADEEIISMAVSITPDTLQYVPKELLANSDFIESMGEITSHNAHCYWGLIVMEFASPELKNNKELAMNLAELRGYGIQYLSDELKQDKELALKAIKTECIALEKLPHFQNDKEFVLTAVESSVGTIRVGFEYASTELKGDRDFVLEVCRIDHRSIQFACDELKNLCGDKNPVKAIEAQIFAEKLQRELSNKEELKPTRKMKI